MVERNSLIDDCFTKDQRELYSEFFIDSKFTQKFLKSELTPEEQHIFLTNDQKLLIHVADNMLKAKFKFGRTEAGFIFDFVNQLKQVYPGYIDQEPQFSNSIFKDYNDYLEKHFISLNPLQYIVFVNTLITGRQYSISKILQTKAFQQNQNHYMSNVFANINRCFLSFETHLSGFILELFGKYEIEPLYQQLLVMEITHFEQQIFNNGFISDLEQVKVNEKNVEKQKDDEREIQDL